MDGGRWLVTILVMRSLTHPSMKSFVVQLGGNFGRTVTLFSPDVTYGEALARREEHLAHLENVNIRLSDELEELHEIQIAKTTAHIGAFQKKDAAEVYDGDQLFA